MCLSCFSRLSSLTEMAGKIIEKHLNTRVTAFNSAVLINLSFLVMKSNLVVFFSCSSYKSLKQSGMTFLWYSL